MVYAPLSLPDFQRRSRALWQRRTPHDLSGEDLRAIRVNISGFFQVLHEWSVRSAAPDVAGEEADRDC